MDGELRCQSAWERWLASEFNLGTCEADTMDTWILKHMNKWLSGEFEDDIADSLRPAMIAIFERDPECWVHRSYWQLVDAVRAEQAHASLISRDGWEDDGERGRR